MSRSLPSFLLLFLLSVVMTGSSHTPAACDYCTNSFFWHEHSHYWVQSIVDNSEGHVGGPYPLDCTEAHAPCAPGGEEQILRYAVALDVLGATTQYDEQELTSILEDANRHGVTAERVEVGIRLAFRCPGARTPLTLDVPMQVPTSFASAGNVSLE